MNVIQLQIKRYVKKQGKLLKIGLQPVVPLEGGGTLKRWGLVEGYWRIALERDSGTPASSSSLISWP
jgi:hypothetical protein